MFRDPRWLLWALPALGAWAALLFWEERRRRALARALGSETTLARLVAPETSGRRLWRDRLEGAALALCFAALAGPQWGVELVETQSRAHNVMIAVDVSESMAAEDLAPSRLEKAKSELAALLDELRGQRVGIVAFAGEAVTVCPLTTDIEAARELLKTLSPVMVPTPGTAVGEAIREATAVLERVPAPRSLVLLSDGEDHKSAPEDAARRAASLGIRILGIGVGTPEGGPIPLREPGGTLGGYKKDRRGQTVVSRLGEKTLQAAAAATGGAYLRASASNGAAASSAAEWILQSDAPATGAPKPGAAVRGSSQRYRNRYLLPLSFAYALLLLSLALPLAGPLGPFPRAKARAALAAAAAFFLALLAARPAFAASAEGSLRRGNRLYEKGEHEAALEAYAESGRRRPKDPRPLFNAGTSLFRMERSEQAAQAFEAAASLAAKNRAARAAALYNEGGARVQSGDYAAAVAALRRLKNPPPPKPKDSKGQGPNQPDKPKSQGQSGGSGSSPQTRGARAEGRLSREDAERILRSADEREKAAQRQADIPKTGGKTKRPKPTEEDW